MKNKSKLKSKLGDWLVLRYYRNEKKGTSGPSRARPVQLLIEIRLLGRKFIGQGGL